MGLLQIFNMPTFKELAKKVEELEEKLEKKEEPEIVQPLEFPEQEVVPRDDWRIIRQAKIGIPKQTAVPTDTPQEGELRLRDNGTLFQLYSFLSGSWRKVGDIDYLDISGHDTTTRHGSSVVDHGLIGGLTDDDHGQYLRKDTLTTKGDIYTRNASVPQRVGVGTNDQVLTADSTATPGVKWATAPAAGWEELGETSLGSASLTIDVQSLATRRTLMIVGTMRKSGAGAQDVRLRFNNDSGTNYGSSFFSNFSSNSSTFFANSLKVGILNICSRPIIYNYFVKRYSSSSPREQSKRELDGTYQL